MQGRESKPANAVGGKNKPRPDQGACGKMCGMPATDAQPCKMRGDQPDKTEAARHRNTNGGHQHRRGKAQDRQLTKTDAQALRNGVTQQRDIGAARGGEQQRGPRQTKQHRQANIAPACRVKASGHPNKRGLRVANIGGGQQYGEARGQEP